jgi:trigger factor
VDTDVTEAGPFERLVTLHLEESELEEAKNNAARKLSREMKIKGFRPGKAPRAIVERMVGASALRAEALEDALPELVGAALADTDLDPVTTPQVQNIEDRDGGGVDVEVKITLWPTVDAVPSLERSIEVAYPVIEDDELQEQIDRVRSQYAELEDVERAADTGDFVLVNVSASRDGTKLEEVNANDLLYEVGSGSYIPGLDDLLVGASSGDIRSGPATLPDGFGDDAGSEVELQVLVKGVRAKKLPEVTDEWVSDVSEFDTAEELTDQLRTSLLAMKLNTTQSTFRDELVDALIADMELELPEALVDAELEASFHNLAHSLQSSGLDLGDYLRITGQDQQAFVDELRDGAERSIRTRVLLEAIAADQGIEVDDAEFEEAIGRMSESSGRDVDDVRSALEASGQVSVLTGDILRTKALERVLEVATAVDSDGNPVDLEIELPSAEDEKDGEDDERETDASGNDAEPPAEEDA